MPTVEYLTNDIVGDEVVNILRNAQARVGAMVPGKEAPPDTCALYSRHAGELAGGLLGRLPVRELPLSLRGLRLESDLGCRPIIGSLSSLPWTSAMMV